jgi:hypothetical protein
MQSATQRRVLSATQRRKDVLDARTEALANT